MRLFLSIVLGIGLMAGYVYAEEEKALKSQKDRRSYSIGVDIGNNLKKQSIDIDTDILTKGLKDAFSGSKTLLTEEEVKAEILAIRNEMRDKYIERRKQLTEKNKKEGEVFLAENKKKEGVITLPSGLQYKVIKEGTGKTPKAADSVTVHYKGTLIDGTEFDSSYARKQPATFRVKGVIAGWTEALQLMKEGAKWQLFIPQDLAYGKRGSGAKIGPEATLIFDIELISIKEKKATKTTK